MSIKTVDEISAKPPAFGGTFDYFRTHLRDYGMLVALAAIVVFFQLAQGNFVTPSNITNLFLQNSVVIIMAIGMLLIIVTGHIDLSVGSVTGFIGGLGAVLMVSNGMPVLPASLICLAVGAAIGAAQGYFVAYFKVPSFIVTLAGMLVFRGLTLMVLGNTSSIAPIPQALKQLSTGIMPDFLPGYGLHMTTLLIGIVGAVAFVALSYAKRAKQSEVGAVHEPPLHFTLRTVLIALSMLAVCTLLANSRGLPNVLILMALLIAVYTFVTTRTTVGRRIYAVGGNEKAAKLSGIKTERLVFLTFVNMGILAALAGLVFAARFGSATAKAGSGLELDVIAACFIGGASAYGGVGKVVGAVVGAFIMGVMNMGMSTMSISIDYQQLIKGLVLLGAVCFDVYNRNKA